MPASRLCKEFRIQNCHDCDDLTCGDNTNKPGKAVKPVLPVSIDGIGDIRNDITPPARVQLPETIYRRALRHYGDRHQLNKMAEEASELSAAISRYKNRDASNDETLLIALVEELADVEIMCQQMRLVFGDQPVDAAKRQKLERLERRLEE